MPAYWRPSNRVANHRLSRLSGYPGSSSATSWLRLFPVRGSCNFRLFPPRVPISCVCPRVPKPAPEMSTRGFRVGTNLERQWPSLYGLRWLLGLGLLLRLQGRPLHGFLPPQANRGQSARRSKKSHFVSFLLTKQKCVKVCVKSYDQDQMDKLAFLKKGIRLNYQHHCYKHSDENPATCNGPPVEIPGEYTDKLNVTYTYSVRLKKTKLSSGLLGGIRFWSLCLILIFSGFGLSCLGFPSPANGGALMTCATVLWVLLGTPARYVSAIMYKTFRGVKWKTNALLTALLCPGVSLSPRLKGSGPTMAHCSLDLLGSSDPSISTFQVAETTVQFEFLGKMVE
uniref:Transmembrane 9 superfamily member n=1 Tax=Papio anubis TaxID=9555 RepID=A0A8I5N536_PAPAN